MVNKNLTNVSAIAGFLTQDLIDSHPGLTGKFDLIIASSVCGFLPDYAETLGLLKSLLKSGGVFIQWVGCRTTIHPKPDYLKIEF